MTNRPPNQVVVFGSSPIACGDGDIGMPYQYIQGFAHKVNYPQASAFKLPPRSPHWLHNPLMIG